MPPCSKTIWKKFWSEEVSLFRQSNMSSYTNHQTNLKQDICIFFSTDKNLLSFFQHKKYNISAKNVLFHRSIIPVQICWNRTTITHTIIQYKIFKGRITINLPSWLRNPDPKANLRGWEQTKGWWWPISTSLCNKVQRVADWPKVKCGEETKEKLFVCSVATPLRLIRHPHIIHFFSKTYLHCYPQTLRPLMSFWSSFAWQGWMAKILFFSVWKQILLRSQRWPENVFVVYLISSLNQTYVAIKQALKGCHAEGIYIWESSRTT